LLCYRLTPHLLFIYTQRGWPNLKSVKTASLQEKILLQNPRNTDSNMNIPLKYSIFNYKMHHESLIMFMCAFVHTWTFIYKAISDCKLPIVLSSQKPDKFYIFKVNYVGRVTAKTHDRKNKIRCKFKCKLWKWVP